jgi:hypothetical protein
MAGGATMTLTMSQSGWLVAGFVPSVERQPLKKLAIGEHVSRWRAEGSLVLMFAA